MKITTIGLGWAKNVFQVHGVDERGNAVLKKQLKRAQVLPFFADREASLVGMEACGGAHYWARKLAQLGHTVNGSAAVCETLGQIQQARCGGCRGNL